MYGFEYVLFFVFASLSFIYLIYITAHLISWNKLRITSADDSTTAKAKISVIIPARNEEDVISRCIESVSVQTYPSHLVELIIVDDHSTDKTKEIAVQAISDMHVNGKVISNKQNQHGKKSAIAEAIKSSAGELIVITDADCYANTKWLSTIGKEYQRTGAFMLCGPVCIDNPSGFLGYFQSLELCGLSLMSGAGIKIGIPLLCNGANMAYTRSIFDELEGFKGIDSNPSGDDILFMFKVHKKYPYKIHYIKSREAIVTTSAQESLSSFLSQRIRWASKGVTSHNLVNSLVSMLVFSINFLSLVAILCILVCGKLLLLPMLGLGIKIAADFLLLLVATDFFGKKKLLWIFPLAELFTMLYVSYVGIVSNFFSYTWKGRLYKRAK